MKRYQRPLFINSMVNSNEDVVHSKTNIIKVVQNQLLFPETIDAVRQLISQDRHVTYCEIEITLGINGTSIHSILHEHFSVKQICSHWILHNLPIAQKKARIDWSKEMLQKYVHGASKYVYDIVTNDELWIYVYESKSKQQSVVWLFPTKVARARSTSKQMIACFCGTGHVATGHVATVPIKQRWTVNSEWHTIIFLPVVFPEIRKTNHRRRIIVHHDNASSHTLAQTTAFLSTQNIDLMSHPPYSPHLTLNDLFLFPYVKNKMRGQRFSTTEEAVDVFWISCFGDTSIKVAKVFQQLVQTHAKAYRS